MSVGAGVAVTTDGRPRRGRLGRPVFVVVVVLFAVLNVYRSTTLSGAPASSHEFSHRQQLRHSPSAADSRRDSVRLSADDGRSTPHSEVDQLVLVRSVRENDFPAYNVTMDTGEVRAVPLWQRRLSRRRANSSANAALEDDIVGPYYFLTELLQVSVAKHRHSVCLSVKVEAKKMSGNRAGNDAVVGFETNLEQW